LLWSFVYLVVRNLFALVWLLGRPRRSKEMEILVLRHELAIRQTSRPKLTRADRALLASLSRSLARPAWAVFPIKPETLLRWHRQLVLYRSLVSNSIRTRAICKFLQGSWTSESPSTGLSAGAPRVVGGFTGEATRSTLFSLRRVFPGLSARRSRRG
jgi:hypothetical protein